ncbi:unnamed protein product [Lymnaea stagnalis]|uniref:Uncharacterized protein n=1 Tax=Lymnaea stagnalis TaxID=6523 RepID=A0AAV2HDX3_LYMST
MSPVPPCAPLYVSVMTQCLGAGEKRSGDLTQAPPRLNARPKPAHFLSFRTGASPRRTPSTSSPVRVCECAATQAVLRVTTQVKRLPGFSCIILLLTLLLIFEPAVARPSVHVNLNKVTFRSQLCRPLSEAELQRLLGSAYAENKMAAEDEAIDKRSGSSGYQGDDPQVSSAYDEKGNVQGAREMQDARAVDDASPFEAVEGEDLMKSGGMDRGVADRGVMDRGVVDRTEKVTEEDGRARMQPRRKVLSRGVSEEERERGYRNTGYDVARQDYDSVTRLESLQTYSYMRRRRRRSLPDAKLKTAHKETTLADHVRQEEEEKMDKKSAGVNRLMRKLFENGDDKDMKRKLKNKYRVKTKNTEKPVPWECKMRGDIWDMEENIYPRSLQTGRCLTTKCFYKLYNCEPIYYSVSVLKLNPIHCNPLPIIGNQTIFEERWEQEHRIITTGCNCVVPRKEPSGRGQG